MIWYEIWVAAAHTELYVKQNKTQQLEDVAHVESNGLVEEFQDSADSGGLSVAK